MNDSINERLDQTEAGDFGRGISVASIKGGVEIARPGNHRRGKGTAVVIQRPCYLSLTSKCLCGLAGNFLRGDIAYVLSQPPAIAKWIDDLSIAIPPELVPQRL